MNSIIFLLHTYSKSMKFINIIKNHKTINIIKKNANINIHEFTKYLLNNYV